MREIRASVGVKTAKRHDPDILVYAADTDRVVALRADDAGAVRSVAVEVHRIVVAVAKVESAGAFQRGVMRVLPHPVLQIRMRIVHAGINDRDDPPAAGRPLIVFAPYRHDVRRMLAVLHAPLIFEIRVVHAARVDTVIRLGVRNAVHGPKLPDKALRREGLRRDQSDGQGRIVCIGGLRCGGEAVCGRGSGGAQRSAAPKVSKL